MPSIRAWSAALLLALTLPACSVSETPCYPSDYRTCYCADGKSGLEVCGAAGDGYGACDCSGAVPQPAPADAGATDAASDDAALMSFGMGCAKDDDCPSGACFVGGMRSFCSYKCA